MAVALATPTTQKMQQMMEIAKSKFNFSDVTDLKNKPMPILHHDAHAMAAVSHHANEKL